MQSAPNDSVNPGDAGVIGVDLGGVRARHTPDVLAGRLRAAILGGQLAEGSRLPSINQLMVDAGVGRSTVREALKILESQGLIEVRAGRGGGPRVRSAGSNAVIDAIEVFIHGRQIKLQTLLDVREAIEPAAAGWAAERASSEEIERLRSAHKAVQDALDDADEFTACNLAWHLEVVRAGHNDLILAMMTSISGSIRQAMSPTGFSNLAMRKRVVQIHARVTERISDGDVAGSVMAMQKHVHAYAEEIRAAVHPDSVSLGPRTNNTTK